MRRGRTRVVLCPPRPSRTGAMRCTSAACYLRHFAVGRLPRWAWVVHGRRRCIGANEAGVVARGRQGRPWAGGFRCDWPASRIVGSYLLLLVAWQKSPLAGDGESERVRPVSSARSSEIGPHRKGRQATTATLPSAVDIVASSLELAVCSERFVAAILHSQSMIPYLSDVLLACRAGCVSG